MRLAIEVIAIGSEILTGFTINTNAAFIGQELLGIGLAVTSQRTLPDEATGMRAGLSDSIKKFDLIICTGGLGPTCDDKTRQIVAEVFDCELKSEPKIIEHLKAKFATRPISLEDQSLVPSKATYILNDLGTASALLIEENNKLFICLPGVPSELQHFMRTKITPLLAQKYASACSEFHQQCNFVQLSESQVDPVLRQLELKYPEAEFGIYPNLGVINVHIVTHFPTTEQNLAYQQPIKQELRAAFAENFFSDTSRDLAQVVTELCRAKNISINLVQTAPYPNLSLALPKVVMQSEFITSAADCLSLLKNLAKSPVGNLRIAITDLPNVDDPEGVYNGEFILGLQLLDQEPIIKPLQTRGNQKMLSKRSENQVLAEIFRLLK